METLGDEKASRFSTRSVPFPFLLKSELMLGVSVTANHLETRDLPPGISVSSSCRQEEKEKLEP